MPVFHVMVHGASIDLGSPELGIASAEAKRVAGFYCWRPAKAETESEAKTAACARVGEEWSIGKYAHLGARPALVASEIRKLSWFARLRASDTGRIFYPHA